MSQNLRILLSSVSLILLGIMADHFLISEIGKETQSKAVPSGARAAGECSPQESSELQTLRRKLTGVSEDDLRTYLKSTNAEEKLRRADEMLAKMMQIFIADLGYKISQGELAQLEKTQPPSSAVDTQPPAKAESVLTATPTPAKDFKKRGVQFFNVQNTEQAREFLKAVAQSDFSASLKASGNLTDDMAKQISGRFTGTITFGGGRTALKAEMSFEGDVRAHKLQGRSDILLSDSKTGKSVSHGRGSGNLNRNYQTYNDAYLIEIGGDYLELYYFPVLDQLMGYYLEKSKADFVRTGAVSLKRI